jgi:hypothetical protein
MGRKGEKVMTPINKVTEDHQESLKIDLKEVSGIQFDPEAKKITSGVIDEIDYIRGLVNHLWGHETREEKEGHGAFGTCLIFGWIDKRLIAVRNHIETVLSQGEKR